VSALTINTIIASGSSNFTTLSAASFSAGTINSGGTEISTLFLNANGSTKLQNGLNTYTGGTYSFPTVNVSALTIQSIIVSGVGIYNTLSGVSFTAGTINSGATNIQSLFAKSGNDNFISLSASNFSAGTYFSGSSTLDSIIYSIALNLDNSTSSTGNTYIQPGLNTYTGGTQSRPTVNISALTINTITASGTSNFITLSATSFSAGTINSGNTEISTLFLNVNGNTKLQNGLNTYTGGTYSFPTINFSSATLNNIIVSGTGIYNTLSGVSFTAGTINSGATNIQSLFAKVANENFTSLSATNFSAGTYFSGSSTLDSIIYSIALNLDNSTSSTGNTYIQNGLNTYTGGTQSRPTVNISALTINTITVSGASNFTALSATSFSAGTINSGGTEISTLFLNVNGSTKFQNGLNTYTGGTYNFPTVNVSALTIQSITVSGVGIYNILSGVSFTAGTINSGATNIQTLFAKSVNENFTTLSSTTFSAGTYFSGSSALSTLFLNTNGGTKIQPGLNTYTGGTYNFPTINLSSATLNNLTVSGNNNSTTLSATTLSATTIYSANTELSLIVSNIIANNVSYGEMYMLANATATVISNTTSFFRMSGTTNAGNLKNFTAPATNRITYTGATNITASTNVNMSVTSASNNQVIRITIFKTGTQIAATEFEMKLTPSNNTQPISLAFITSLAQNDYLEVYLKNTTGANNITINSLQFVTTKLL
jgi:hypothetical protein